jgi:hypothetical protein
MSNIWGAHQNANPGRISAPTDEPAMANPRRTESGAIHSANNRTKDYFLIRVNSDQVAKIIFVSFLQIYVFQFS